MDFDRNAITNADQLHHWIRTNLELTIPRRASAGHAAPFDYIAHAFFEGVVPGGDSKPADCIVWANRGGGKTFLGALATTLDLLFKPGIQVRILAGSLEQASRMHEHLRNFFERPALKQRLRGRITDRRITLDSKSRVELLAQSQASVRGIRPHKLRCDEVELFDPEVWSAAQLTTRSGTLGGRLVRGSIECLSTMHLPHGLMARLVEEPGRALFKWGVADILDRCGDEHRCEGPCPLAKECGGRAKEEDHTPGHFSVADALRLKSRVSADVWDAEMLCNRPSRAHSVFPEFDPARHVFTDLPPSPAPTFLAGMDFGFRSPTVFLWAAAVGDRLYIIDEHVQSGLTLEAHIRAIQSSVHPHPAWIGADPAGDNRHEQTGLSNIAILKRAGLSVRIRRCPTLEGLLLIRARLAPADGSPPRLFVHPRCGRLIESLERYHYDTERPLCDDPVKDGPDHAVDALRYLVTNLDAPFTSSTGMYA